MKKIVHPSYFVFEPSNNRIDFTAFPNFNFTFLYAVINVTAGKIIYSTAGEPAGLQGSYSAPFLNLNLDVTSMGSGDELQIIYNLPAQPIADADENAIFSTIDIDSGERGLNFNLLNSSFGGRINEPLSSPHEDKALAIGINSGGFLRSPAIDPVTNQLIVDISQSGTIPTSIVNNPQVLSYVYNPNTSSPVSFGAGATDINTQRVTANINQISDTVFTGSAQTAAQNNIISGGATATDCLGFRSFSAQLTCSATAGTFIFEGSNDNTNFQAIPVFNQALLTGVSIVAAITATASQIIYTGSIPFRYLRIRIATTLTGGTVTAHVKLSPIAFHPTVQMVANSAAANLNAAITGSATVSGTVTATVAAATLGTANTTDIASAAIVTTATSANIALTNAQTIALQVAVTAVSGTTPTMDIVIQETFDTVNYFDMYHFPRITSAGQYQTPLLRMSGIGYRVVRTIAGTTPSFTMSLTRVSRQCSSGIKKLFINRTIDPNALASSTPAFNTDGCTILNLCVSMNGGGSGTPTFKLQGSEDQVLWFDLGTATVAVAPSSAGVAIYSGYLPKFARAQVTATGSGTTLSQCCIKGNGE
jgi:hypothetical protein